MFIVEDGLDAKDELIDGKVDDQHRIDYFDAHFREMYNAIYVDGVAYATKTSSDPQGNWRSDFLDEVTPGTHAFHVVANNSLGTSEPSNAVTATFKLYTGEVVVNNILTPNGDGKNDLWIAKDLSLMYSQNEAIVYDKTGKVVFKKANYQSDWDGTYNSSPLSTGTYYYEINIGAGLKPLKGMLTILRGR